MKRAIKWVVIVAVAAAAVFALIRKFNRAALLPAAEKVTGSDVLAVYDRNNPTMKNSYSGYGHIVVRLAGNGSSGLTAAVNKIWPAGIPVIITLETWPGMSAGSGGENILAQVAAGKQDEGIKELAAIINRQQQPVLVRLDPDMEVYVDVFPWQKQSAAAYTKAFNHVAALLKKEAPATKMVWSPAGYPGTEEYWPGAEWVDLVAVTLKGKSEGMVNNYPEAKDQQELISRKLHRMRFFDKPVLLLGSSNLSEENFEKNSFAAAVNYLQQNKDIVYKDINAADKEIEPALLRTDGSLITGAFDPSHSLVDSVPLSAEHLFVNIPALKSGEFKAKFDTILSRNRDAIVTMEPWKEEGLKNDPALVANILAGKYDDLFERLWAVIGHTNRTIYLRWLHEMEIPITRYPWQSQDPVGYIKAYRYFVNYIRSKKPSHIYFVWGPAGDRGSMEFWPGSDVVDYTSIAIYGLPDKNITDHNKQESFNTIFQRKYKRVWFSHKPLFITEFGVKGPAAYKKEWLAGAANTIEENKGINGISYFSDSDNPKAWGDIEAPDWSISPALYKELLDKLKTAVKH